MKNNTHQTFSIILNSLIVILTVFASYAIFNSFEFMGHSGFAENAPHFKIFKYFTVDSNIFAGIVSLIFLIYYLTKKNKESILPKPLFLLKLAATTGVTLTMMVTVFYLGPKSDEGYFALFMNASLIMHLITPLLCIISFVFFEKTKKNSKRLSITGIIPMLLYSVFYISNIFMHLKNNKTSRTYDLYGFLDGGLQFTWIVIPLIFGITWFFAFSLLALNKKCNC